MSARFAFVRAVALRFRVRANADSRLLSQVWLSLEFRFVVLESGYGWPDIE